MAGKGRTGLLVSAFMGTFIALLDLTIVNVALPEIQADLRTDVTGLQWVADGFTVPLAALMLSGGALGDRFGRKRLFLGGIGLFMAGSVVCAAASGLGVLVAGRAVQGVAAAIVVPGALSLIGQAEPDPQRRARLMGLWGMFSGLAVISGPLLGGVLVDTLGWPSIFLVNVPLGLAAVAIGLRSIPESADPAHAALDPAGQLAAVAALGSLTYGVIEAREHGWSSPPTLGFLTAAVVAGALLVVLELRNPRPMLPVRLFSDARFAIANAASVALGFGANGAFFVLTVLYLQELRGHSAMATGVLLLPMTLAIMPAAVVAGRLTAAFGARRPMVLGYALTGVALAGMGVLDAGTPYLAIGALFVVAGVGQGLAITPAAAAVLEIVPRERTGIASATVNTARQAGTALGIAVLGTVAAGSGGLAAGVRTSLVAAGAVVLAAAALLVLMPGRGSHPRSTSVSPRADAGIPRPGRPAGT
ncbi:DHA2 family efflux MFS transporter permease subunit [Actinomadura rudentiformis]|uniref:DHA2 family efflux MFS transporter permease subunit n=1 Tax=Actinomadura rudentiformis TaxID=359158 RepID=A0A6H9Z5U8_9ACTN|nr:DHA2 family efflux MFS transporter permease subunit [Actinomadura rudentiformis]KAB2352698.1 DHA2 family efflux MFS transporter permease subunit [Actinomadura rudentiformis]